MEEKPRLRHWSFGFGHWSFSYNLSVLHVNLPFRALGDIRFVRQSNLEKTVRYCSGRSFRPWMLRFGFMPPHPSFFARRNLFARLGYYKTDYRIAADFELLVRFLWINRIRSKYLALATTKMRLGGMSTRSPHSTWILNREQVRACRENGRFTTLPVLSFKYLFKVFELVYTRNP